MIYIGGVQGSVVTTAASGGQLRLNIACYLNVPLASVTIASVAAISGGSVGTYAPVDSTSLANVQSGSCGSLQQSRLRVLRRGDEEGDSLTKPRLAQAQTALPASGSAVTLSVTLWNTTAAQQANVVGVVSSIQV